MEEFPDPDADDLGNVVEGSIIFCWDVINDIIVAGVNIEVIKRDQISVIAG